jgi:hypothetical protein
LTIQNDAFVPIRGRMTACSETMDLLVLLFRDTIIKLIQAPNLEYKELTAQQAEPAA